MDKASFPLTATAGGVKVRVRLTPRAGRDRIEGVLAGGDGRAVLKVAVAAPPEGGKANAALIKLLARAWRLPKTSLSIVAGATTRGKTVLIGGNSADITQRLNQWIGNQHG